MKMNALTPSDYPQLKRFFEAQKYPLCVYSLSSLLVWSSRIYQPCGLVISDDTFVAGVEFAATHAEKRHLILPLSPVKSHSPEELIDISLKTGFETYWFVPEIYLESFGKDRTEALFQIEEQPEFEDYVYLREDLAELKGNRYSKKRNLISQFNREYADRVQIEALTASLASECIDFLEKWCKERDCDKEESGDLSCEKRAAINALGHIDNIGMTGILVRIDGTVSAFGIASRLTSDTGVLHFEKAFAHIKGLYQFLDNLCAKQLLADVKYINKESDMNEPGLAKTKKSYHPVMMIKSYKLTVR
ncbi:MAG: hypothetical protein BWK80_16030 [Desulfobacteraceae bacterium IS3]|nr:MAG: hypothetical protein BWK80_16030 [Desulfobacteraceae bacterium IS3]